MKRGDIVIAAEKSRVGGKPRPWLIVQSDAFNETHASVTVCMISANAPDIGLFRLAIDPSNTNGLAEPSTIFIDVLLSVSRRSIHRVVGRADRATMTSVDAALKRWLNL
ncbi:MAG: type II toxin-antitoxin system PemK/MazF family toxin [Sphingomonas sp.]